MLLPRFTIRGLFVLITASSFVALVAMYAARGSRWAMAITIAFLGTGVVFLCYAFCFAAAYLLAATRAAIRPPVDSSSPFASTAPPPQLVPPEEPES
jgi:hypothetical protein